MNTPNKITLSRLLLLPVIIFFYLADFIPYARLVSSIVFVIACLTDFLDGHIARKYNQVTTLGKFFDSIADKVLITTGLILIVSAPITGSAPVVYPSWAGVVCVIIILAREFIVSALRQIAASKGTVLAADMGGKIKATIQYISVSLYMFYAFFLTDLLKLIKNTDVKNVVTGTVGFILLILLVLATFATIYSGASYLIRNKHVFAEDNKEENKEYENEKIVIDSNENPSIGEVDSINTEETVIAKEEKKTSEEKTEKKTKKSPTKSASEKKSTKTKTSKKEENK